MIINYDQVHFIPRKSKNRPSKIQWQQRFKISPAYKKKGFNVFFMISFSHYYHIIKVNQIYEFIKEAISKKNQFLVLIKANPLLLRNFVALEI